MENTCFRIHETVLVGAGSHEQDMLHVALVFRKCLGSGRPQDKSSSGARTATPRIPTARPLPIGVRGGGARSRAGAGVGRRGVSGLVCRVGSPGCSEGRRPGGWGARRPNCLKNTGFLYDFDPSDPAGGSTLTTILCLFTFG